MNYHRLSWVHVNYRRLSWVIINYQEKLKSSWFNVMRLKGNHESADEPIVSLELSSFHTSANLLGSRPGVHQYMNGNVSNRHTAFIICSAHIFVPIFYGWVGVNFVQNFHIAMEEEIAKGNENGKYICYKSCSYSVFSSKRSCFRYESGWLFAFLPRWYFFLNGCSVSACSCGETFMFSNVA